MLCEGCGVDMMLVRQGEDGPIWACVNPRCPSHKAEIPEKTQEANKT